MSAPEDACFDTASSRHETPKNRPPGMLRPARLEKLGFYFVGYCESRKILSRLALSALLLSTCALPGQARWQLGAGACVGTTEWVEMVVHWLESFFSGGGSGTLSPELTSSRGATTSSFSAGCNNPAIGNLNVQVLAATPRNHRPPAGPGLWGLVDLLVTLQTSYTVVDNSNGNTRSVDQVVPAEMRFEYKEANGNLIDIQLVSMTPDEALCPKDLYERITRVTESFAYSTTSLGNRSSQPYTCSGGGCFGTQSAPRTSSGGGGGGGTCLMKFVHAACSVVCGAGFLSCVACGGPGYCSPTTATQQAACAAGPACAACQTAHGAPGC